MMAIRKPFGIAACRPAPGSSIGGATIAATKNKDFSSTHAKGEREAHSRQSTDSHQQAPINHTPTLPMGWYTLFEEQRGLMRRAWLQNRLPLDKIAEQMWALCRDPCDDSGDVLFLQVHTETFQQQVLHRCWSDRGISRETADGQYA